MSEGPGTLPAGTAQVTINGAALPRTTAVKCTQVGSLTTISAGDATANMMAQVSNAKALTAKSVSFTDLGGFTGSYMEGVGGKTDVTLKDKTYTIRGNAEGFNANRPDVRTTDTFTVTVAC